MGGSFDPVHHGHLILAREAMEMLGLEKVVFIPAAQSPHKLDRIPAPAEDRLEMLRAAVEGEPGFEVDDCELRREPPSFTIDTVREYKGRYPDVELIYLIGSDNVPELDTWKDIALLEQLVRFVVLDRSGTSTSCPFQQVSRPVDISSTEIRNRVAKGMSVRYLLPEKAWEVLERKKLYRT